MDLDSLPTAELDPGEDESNAEVSSPSKTKHQVIYKYQSSTRQSSLIPFEGPLVLLKNETKSKRWRANIGGMLHLLYCAIDNLTVFSQFHGVGVSFHVGFFEMLKSKELSVGWILLVLLSSPKTIQQILPFIIVRACFPLLITPYSGERAHSKALITL